MGRPAKHTPEPGNSAINDSEVPIQIRLSIPRDLYAEYEKLAESQGLTVTELVMHRLKRCKDHNSLRPLYFTDSQRTSLETILQKRPLETADQAMALIMTSLSVHLGNLPTIPLTPQQLKRISMGGYAGQTAEERFIQIVQSAVSKNYGV